MVDEAKQSADGFYSINEQKTTQLDGSWRNKIVTHSNPSNLSVDVDSREIQENQVVIEARRKIMEIMAEPDNDNMLVQQPSVSTSTLSKKQQNTGLTLDDLSSGLDSNSLTNIGLGINDVAQKAAVGMVQDAYLGTGDEASMLAEANSSSPHQQQGSWATEKKMATLRGGNKVPVWVVANESTGISMKKPFRIQAPAERIATVLNLSGNVNDPRIYQIQEDYDVHVKLMRGIRECRTSINEGQHDLKPKLQGLMMKLEGINVRLGI